MHNYKKVTDDIYWVGGSDRRLARFENIHPVTNGVSYNAYLIKDEKNTLVDAVDSAVAKIFFENISELLGDEKLKFIIVNHVEPDHVATLSELLARYPEATVICGEKTKTLISQFFANISPERIKAQDSLNIGKHEFELIAAPMVHWPEVTVAYEKTKKVLFSADAFGTFGALMGSVFADEYDFENEWLADARRYYTNIVGKYGKQVQSLLKKVQELEIEYILPLHGPIWRENIAWFINKYSLWSSYEPEKTGVLIIYGSAYNNTQNAAEILAFKLCDLGVKNISIFDVSGVDQSYILSECFKYSHIVFASTTYNNGIFTAMENLLRDVQAHNLQNRTVAFIENGSWAPASKRLMSKIITELKDITILESSVTLKSTVTNENLQQIETLANEIYKNLFS